MFDPEKAIKKILGIDNILDYIPKQRKGLKQFGTLKCEASNEPNSKEQCGEPAEYFIIMHSGIYANLEEVNCQKIPICKRHKEFFSQDEFKGTFKAIEKI